MTRHSLAITGAVLVFLVAASDINLAQRPSTYSGRPEALEGRPVTPVPSHQTPAATPESQRALIEEYCFTCHDDEVKRGELTLEKFDTARVEQAAEVAEKIIRKLRAGMMPPAGVKRPDAATLDAFATSLETRLDRAAALRPNPGRRSFLRLNRAEYARSIRDLLLIDVDVTSLLPPDTVSHNFDNIADAQSFSPTLLEGYLRAAARISREALGDPDASPTSATYKVPRTASQLHHVEGAPIGTRGGISLVHNFPADGEYVFKMMLHSIPTGQLYGSPARGEQVEVSINGARVALVDINPRMSEADPTGMTLQTPPVAVRTGPQRVSAAFIRRSEGPVDDLLIPIEYTLADTQIGAAVGVNTVPHLRDFAVTGPHKVTGVSDTPSRRNVFTCRPTEATDEAACARQIVTHLATQAYRRPVDADDLTGLMRFYDQGRTTRDFESGIRTALQAILASPHFVFRLEELSPSTRSIENQRVTDLDLASRLSYFLWASAPDAELVTLASQGALRKPAVLDRQVRRMLADARAESLATRFASQWLRLQDLDKIHPDALLYPQFDHGLAESMQRETELLFEHLVREDRSVLELLTADYTFVNERLARHYGIPNVAGSRFQRVPLAGDERRGLLGHGSILMMTSVADRTSPVYRGKWVMEVVLGSPPPQPPVDVPDLEVTRSVEAGKLLSVRERMALHRSNPTCNSCHRVIDPLGLALENFDVTGAWRIKDNGVPIDATGTLYDGSVLDGPASLRKALLNRSEVVLRNFTENLMAYALGRRVEYYDMPAVRAIVRNASPRGNRMSAFIEGIVRSPAFQMSRVEPRDTTIQGSDADTSSRKRH